MKQRNDLSDGTYVSGDDSLASDGCGNEKEKFKIMFAIARPYDARA